jgi:hypothetical protein
VIKQRTNSALLLISELEQTFDLKLGRPRVSAGDPTALLLAAARWSGAVWTAAEIAGPLTLNQIGIALGLAIAHRPIHICGVHRSGTTLIRDLLDCHPALAVLPSEGTFFTNYKQQLRRLPLEQWQSHFGCDWLRRLANPIHQAPYWLLGRSSQEASPYLEFARSLMAWWPLVRDSFADNVISWPLTAVALAYAHSMGGLRTCAGTQFWVEKTPRNERYIDRLRTDSPQAKVVHVIRHPYAVFASHKQAMRDAGESFSNAGQVLQDLKLSYRIAAKQSLLKAPNQYHLMRYEELIASPQASIDRLAEFLGIDSLPILTRPTAAGAPTSSNSSFFAETEPGRLIPAIHEKWREVLTKSDCQRISALVGEAAALVGYELAPVSAWRVGLLRISAPITSRLQ